MGVSPAFTEAEATYTYSGDTGRLASVAGASGSGSFQYAYEADSNLLATVTGPEHTVINTYESTRNVLASKESELPGGTLSKFTYSVNAIGQRTSLATTGSAFGNTVAHLFDTVRRCRIVTVSISSRLPRSHRLFLPLGSYIAA